MSNPSDEWNCRFESRNAGGTGDLERLGQFVVPVESVDRVEAVVHWTTDLAGAEPSPLGGAEKFVLKFPHAVLDSFIRSFAVLNELAVKSETAVMEGAEAMSLSKRSMASIPLSIFVTNSTSRPKPVATAWERCGLAPAAIASP